jgi:hypothetical protein
MSAYATLEVLSPAYAGGFKSRLRKTTGEDIR